MKLVAVMMVKDEADILATTVRHTVAEGADLVIVADNLSTDDTRDILRDLMAEGLPIEIRDDPVVAYQQAEKMTRLAQLACERGADWVWPLDADEFFHAPDPSDSVRDVLSRTTADVVLAHGWDHIATQNPPTAAIPGPWRRPEPQKLGKVLFRADPSRVLEMGNHSVSPADTIDRGTIVYRHAQYRSLEQMTRKLRDGAKAYAESDVHEMHGTHWREGGKLTDAEMKSKWDALTTEPDLVWDPAPVSGRTVSVVIPTRDRADLLADCVRSVKEHSPGAEIVVADGPRSFAENCNMGAVMLGTDVLVFLNDDTIVRPNWLEPLVRRVGWGIVGANLVNPDGTPQHSGTYFRRDRGVLEAYNTTAPRPASEVPAVTGACMAITADLFDRLDGFDTEFVNGYDDVDLALRARQAGWRCFYEPASVVEHALSQSAGRFDFAAENVRLLDDRWGGVLDG